jgi:ribosome biogenesis protein BRX1
MELVEVGPRFILDPIKICAGSMGGPAIYQNGSYISPGAERALRTKATKSKASVYIDRVMKRVRLDNEKQEISDTLPKHVTDSVFANEEEEEDDE